MAAAAARFSKWAICFVVVDFNVDLGPEIRTIYPQVTLSPQDEKKICFSALPERACVDESTTHVFRFSSNNKVIYATCLYTCSPDPQSKRGYNQSSLLLLSYNNYPCLFQLWLDIIQHQENTTTNKQKILDTAVTQINTLWPDPPSSTKPSVCFTSPFFDVDLHVDTSPGNCCSPPLLHHVYLSSPFGSWNDVLPLLSNPADLYTMYEMLLFNRPLAIMADSATIASKAVSCLSNLISPLSIQQSRIEEYATLYDCDNPTSNSHVLIGFTNPQLFTTLAKDTLILSLENPPPNHTTAASSSKSSSPVDSHHQSTKDFIKSRKSHSFRLNNNNNNRKPSTMLVKDRKFLDLISKLPPDSSSIDEIINLHFNQLTHRILTPLDFYLSSSSAPTFNLHDFLYFINQACKGNIDSQPHNSNNNNKIWKWNKPLHTSSLLGISQPPLLTTDPYPRKIFYSRLAESPSFLSWISNR